MNTIQPNIYYLSKTPNGYEPYKGEDKFKAPYQVIVSRVDDPIRMNELIEEVAYEVKEDNKVYKQIVRYLEKNYPKVSEGH